MTDTVPTNDTGLLAAEYDQTPVFDSVTDFDQSDSAGSLIIKKHQYIPDDFISDLKSNKMDSRNTPCGEMLHVCSIPVSVIEWLKEVHHFDAMNEPIRRTIVMLQSLGMDAFITTDKRI